MKVTFLGTGTSQGVPIIACKCLVCSNNNPKNKRLRSSIQIEINDKIIVIDSGPDFRQQMLRQATPDLHALIFTHEHKDHIAGMDDIRGFNYVHQKPINIYCTKQVEQALRREYQYIFSDFKYPGIPEITLNNFENKEFEVEGVKIIPILVWHYKLPVFGFRINDFTYITDANKIDDEELEKIKGSKILVLNALRRETHISHFNLDEAIAISKLIKAEKTYFTHISHQLGLHDEVNAELPNGIELAYDGLQLNLK